MSALPLKLKPAVGKAASAAISPAASVTESGGIYIPPPIATEKASLEQIRASLELGIAEARAGIGEDFDVVQARLRAKFFPSSR